MSDFTKNVFVNCPFDDDYRQILLTIVFTVKYFALEPKLALQTADSGDTRIAKIVDLIKNSKFGIHDLSRMFSTKKNQPARMNMPFELGIDYGCQKLKGGRWGNKKLLVLEAKKYSFHQALSDMSGSDIKHHNNQPRDAVSCVRNWLVTEEFQTGDSANTIWTAYNVFQGYLYDEVVGKRGYEGVDDVQISEVITYMKNWFVSIN